MASAAAAALVCAAVSGCSSGRAPSGAARVTAAASLPDSYGALPSFLPAGGAAADRTLTGSTDRPALTVEGDPVQVLLGGGAAASISVSGPVVPGEGLPHATPAPTCTWTVSVTAAGRAVPLNAAAFTTLDHLGTVYRLAFVPGAPRPPAVLPAHRHVAFELRTVMPAGEGLLRWAPVHGRIVASWDFEVEND